MADDFCVAIPYHPQCLETANAIILVEWVHRFRLGFMIFWNPSSRWEQGWFQTVKFHYLVVKHEVAIKTSFRVCVEEAADLLDDLGDCIWRKMEARKLTPRSALLVPTLNIRWAAPDGYIEASGFTALGVSMTFLCQPNFLK